MEGQKNIACLYSPREIWRPVLVAVVEHVDELQGQYWSADGPVTVWPHGVYITKEVIMPKRDPTNLRDEGGHFPSRQTLSEEFILLQEQGLEHDAGWVAQRLDAIFKFLGFKPKGSAIPAGHPKKIPNRRLP